MYNVHNKPNITVKNDAQHEDIGRYPAWLLRCTATLITPRSNIPQFFPMELDVSISAPSDWIIEGCGGELRMTLLFTQLQVCTRILAYSTHDHHFITWSLAFSISSSHCNLFPHYITALP